MAWFAATEQRSHVVSFSAPLGVTYPSILIRNPAHAINLKAYTSTLTNLTWLLFLTWVVATPPILYIVAR